MILIDSIVYRLYNKSDENTLKRLVEATDKRIDGIVYSLYGLSEEEIKIVEG